MFQMWDGFNCKETVNKAIFNKINCGKILLRAVYFDCIFCQNGLLVLLGEPGIYCDEIRYNIDSLDCKQLLLYKDFLNLSLIYLLHFGSR